MFVLRRLRQGWPALLIILLLWWNTPAYSVGVLLGSNLSAGDRNFMPRSGLGEQNPGFQVWLHDHLQIDVQMLSDQKPLVGRSNSLEFCVNSNQESRPVHVAISVDTRIFNYEKKSVSTYSFYLGASQGWRSSSDYFDYMIDSGNNCTELNKIKLGYVAQSLEQKKLDQKDFIDTITLTIRPE